MLKRIWIEPPLAFARVGPSPVPCEAFNWGADDLTPDGTGITTLVLAETLTLAEDGTVTAHLPDVIRFRDDQGIRPVCPFFELHGEWVSDGKPESGPLTATVLAALGVSLGDVRWGVRLANLKAYHYTFVAGDRVEAESEIRADDHGRLDLMGTSPASAPQPLVPPGTAIRMGAVQAARPSEEFPELRLRFHAPAGVIYGPTDLAERLSQIDFGVLEGNQAVNLEWRGFSLQADQLRLNPNAAWCRYVIEAYDLPPIGPGDYRNNPSFLLAHHRTRTGQTVGLGLIDDVSDGLVTCTVQLRDGAAMTAVARIAVGPPDFAPGHRHVASLADALADREDRWPSDLQDWTLAELGDLVEDIFERAFETSELMNRDAQKERSHRTNAGIQTELGPNSFFNDEDVAGLLWPRADKGLIEQGKESPFELSMQGTRKHRRHAVRAFLEQRFREDPGLLERWIRPPLEPSRFYDRRMPPLMRGSDGRPFHLTRRQWNILRAWVSRLAREPEQLPEPVRKAMS